MDLSTAQTHLALWLAANQAVANGQSFSHADRTLTHYDLPKIRNEITYWQRVVDSYSTASAGGNTLAAKACWNSCS